jgi:predicted ABC-type ATPase
MFGFLVCGPPGTGKSSHISEMLKLAGIRGKYALIDPDLQEGETHLIKSQKAIELIKESIQKKKSFVYVATCGGLKVVMSLLSAMKAGGFRTVVSIPYTTLSTALKRISQREQVTPEEVSRDLHAFFATKAEAYMKLKNLDEVYLYNNETDFNLLYSRKKKKIVCTPGEFYFDVSPYC